MKTKKTNGAGPTADLKTAMISIGAGLAATLVFNEKLMKQVIGKHSTKL